MLLLKKKENHYYEIKFDLINSVSSFYLTIFLKFFLCPVLPLNSLGFLSREMSRVVVL